ncbi:MAG: hypothetical protein KDE58_37345, partial [Caldilineaceae bacterium]|nr:hypothetical protein [Caldilineaceae bacterium]
MTDSEQAVFAKLAIFRDGFTREAAQAVADADLTVLTSLVNKSFIRFRQEMQRYEIHELMRQFGAEKLAEDTNLEKTTKNHYSQFFCTFLQKHDEALKGADQQTALAKIALDLENAVVGWRWTVRQSRWPAVLKSMDGLCRFYEWQGRLPEGLTICNTLIELFEQIAFPLVASQDKALLDLLWAKVLRWQGVFYWLVGKDEQAKRSLEQSIEWLDRIVPESNGVRLEKAVVFRYLAEQRIEVNYRRAKTLLERSFALFEQCDERWEAANTLAVLGGVLERRSHYAGARQILEQSLGTYHQLHDQRGTAATLNRLGVLAGYEGRTVEGVDLLRQSDAIYQTIGDQVRSIETLRDLSFTLSWHGDYHEAYEILQHILP